MNGNTDQDKEEPKFQPRKIKKTSFMIHKTNKNSNLLDLFPDGKGNIDERPSTPNNKPNDSKSSKMLKSPNGVSNSSDQPSKKIKWGKIHIVDIQSIKNWLAKNTYKDPTDEDIERLSHGDDDESEYVCKCSAL